MTNPEKLSTLQEVALRFRVSDKTVRRWIDKGEIEVIGAGRQLRFEERELKRFTDLKRRARDRQQPRTKRAYTRRSA